MSEHDPARICKNCRWWERDLGTFTATGWTNADRLHGWCQYEPVSIPKNGMKLCHCFEPKTGGMR